MLSRTAELVEQCRKWYEGFEFHRVFHALHDFAVVDLSAFYFDVLKDRLYTFAARNRARRSAQTAVYRIAKALLSLVTPITVFTAEEIWRHFPHVPGDPESAHLALFSEAKGLGSPLDAAKTANWEKLLVLRNDVLSTLETARSLKLVAGSLEARVSVEPRANLPAAERAELISLLDTYKAMLPAFLIVSQFRSGLNEVELPGAITENAPKASPWIVRVERAQGAKCERCWNYSTHVGENADYPTVCERCVKALNEIEETGRAGAQGAATS
jgi:isoleucyl-tRNA synthetase